MNYQKIFSMLLLALLMSACVQQQPVVNNLDLPEDLHPVDIPLDDESEEVTEDVEKNIPLDDELKDVEEEITGDWKIYRNEEIGFEFKYPSDWSFSDCSDLQRGIADVSIYMSKEETTCNSPGGRINVSHFTAPYDASLYENHDYQRIINKYDVVIENFETSYELKGPEGETRPARPEVKAVYAEILYKEGSIGVSYSEIFKVEKEDDYWKIDEDFSSVYYEILDTFKFID